jgi:hypothetical protein
MSIPESKARSCADKILSRRKVGNLIRQNKNSLN